MSNEININVWDDYFDDGYVPEGKIQKTYAYVESDLEDFECKSVLEYLMQEIQKKIDKTSNIKLSVNLYKLSDHYPQLIGTENEHLLYERWQLDIENMSHLQREDLVTDLASDNLLFNGKEITVYSES